MMKYTDRIYGEIEITEPVLLELMESKALARLKGIDQHGYFEPYFPNVTFSRFEHSVGVLALLKKYKASLAEQASGLIHDVSHTVFSHVGDAVFGTLHNQSNQDKIHKTYVLKSDIPQILKKHGLSPDYILNEENFPLLETKLPDLCADRIDYSLREMSLNYRDQVLMPPGILKRFLDSLVVDQNKWIIQDKKIARQYVKDFLWMNYEVWSSPDAVAMFVTVSDMLKSAILKGYITESDLFTTDDEVFEKIKAKIGSDKEMARLYKLAISGLKFKIDYNHPDIKIKIKSRAIDPWVGEKRFSVIDPDYRRILHKSLQPIEYALKFVDDMLE